MATTKETKEMKYQIDHNKQLISKLFERNRILNSMVFDIITYLGDKTRSKKNKKLLDVIYSKRYL